MRQISIAFAALALTACGGPVITETKVKTVPVAVRAPCPDEATMAAVNDARPVPLRDWPADMRPNSDAEARQIEREQLGRYEAPDAWADQAQAVMDRCFKEGVEPLPAQ